MQHNHGVRSESCILGAALFEVSSEIIFFFKIFTRKTTKRHMYIY